MPGRMTSKTCPRHGPVIPKFPPSGRTDWRCVVCRRERERVLRGVPGDRLGMPPRARGAMRNLKYGGAALASPPPEDGLGIAVLEAVRSGGDVRAVMAAVKCSEEMARYWVKRMAERRKGMLLRSAGLEALTSDLARASRELTPAQIEAATVLLSGASEVECARQFGVTQAAISSRLRIAARRLRCLGGAWAGAIADGLESVGRHRNLTSFQEHRRADRR